MGAGHGTMTMIWFLKGHLFISLLVVLYILARSHESGDDPLIWVPVVILLPIFGLSAYIIFRIARRVDDVKWEKQKMNVSQGNKFYASRRVKSEQELKDRYNKGKARKG